jgi:hypothetical protein
MQASFRAGSSEQALDLAREGGADLLNAERHHRRDPLGG